VEDATEASAVAAQLACMPDVVARLLAEHVPDRNGRCLGCGFPGTGSPYLRSPCGLWLVAEAARRFAQRRPLQGSARSAVRLHAATGAGTAPPGR
jgi:hypothetical protein